MKTKKMHKKLDLNKITVANLNNVDMKKLWGGITTTLTEKQSEEHSDCPGCTYTCPPPSNPTKDPVIPTV